MRAPASTGRAFVPGEQTAQTCVNALVSTVLPDSSSFTRRLADPSRSKRGERQELPGDYLLEWISRPSAQPSEIKSRLLDMRQNCPGNVADYMGPLLESTFHVWTAASWSIGVAFDSV